MDGEELPVGALLRRPSTTVRRRLVSGLHEAGFTDLQSGHLAVLTWPGPEGRRPGVLARRADASKQAMNHLLGQLDEGGYLSRDVDPGDRRTRVVRLTDRGRAAVQVLRTLLDEVDEEWRRVLGEDDYQVLRSALGRLHDHLGETRADEQSDDAT